MSPIIKLRITFDTEGDVFFAGTSATGHIHVLVEEKGGAKVRGVKIEWKGESSTHFRFRGNKYSKSETILENEMYIMGSGDRSKPTIMLQEGTHAIPFSILLPPNIPGSIELEKGKIYYQVYAKVNIPYDIFDPNTTRQFTVIKQYLIGSPACNPIEQSLQKEVGMWCFSKGSVSAVIGLQRSGFVPGEELHFSLNIENESSKEIKRACVELCQFTYFFGIRRTNKRVANRRSQYSRSRTQQVHAPLKKEFKSRKVWTELEFPPINPGDTFTSPDNVLTLNSQLLLSNFFDNSTLMRTHYTLQVTLFFSCPYSNKTMTIPIEMGSSYISGAPIHNEPNIFMPSAAGPALLQIPYPPHTYPSGGGSPQGPMIETPQIYPAPSAPLFGPNIPSPSNMEYSLPPPYNPMPEEQKLNPQP